MRAMLDSIVAGVWMLRSGAGGPRASEALGFTLVEMMMVILIAAILAGLAVPAMRGFMANNRLASLTDSFESALSLARSEAAKANAQVAMTPLPTGSGKVWSGGWSMFVDANSNNSQDAGEPSIRVGVALPSDYTLNSSTSFSGVIAFDGTGRLVGGNPGLFVICQNGGPWGGGAARMITVAASGRARIATNDSSGHPLDDTGTAITGCAP